ncbi:MAG TPA: YceI family protein [Bacteroidetes bacterium]|nr:YceI family protein [Bacteroidota bacterium]
MKRLFGICIVLISLASMNLMHQDHYTVDNKKSTITWTGEKIASKHTGNISISKGIISIDHGNIAAASFEVDMNSITNADLESEKYNKMLVDHLNGEDFFDIKKYPVASFKMLKSKQTTKAHIVKGELTIKDKVHPVTATLNLEQNETGLVVRGEMIFDRTKFGIVYKSGNFFESLGDKMIHDEVKLQFEITATRKQ